MFADFLVSEYNETMTVPENTNPSGKPEQTGSDSPFWGTNTKLIVGLLIAAFSVGILSQLRPILTPIALALILSYLLFPLIEDLTQNTFFSWRGATNLVFFLLLIILLSSLTASGVAIVNQFQNLIGIIETFLGNLPDIVQNFISTDPVITIPIIGYQFDIAQYIQSLNIDLIAISNQVLSSVQPVLGQAGTILTRVATSALSVLGWGGFILVIAYLILGEAKKGSKLLQRELFGLSEDITRFSREFSYIWNAFLRGQLLVFFLSSATMFILMSILGVRYALVLAILAGFARFIPYVGQFISAIVNALVAYFLAAGNYFGLPPFQYMLLVVGVAFIHDQIYDSLVIPRLIGFVLGVHPAMVLITALIAARWVGVLGLLLAAPMLASFQLLTRYVIRKMLDQDPWPDEEIEPPTLKEQFRAMYFSARDWVVKTAKKIGRFSQKLYQNISQRIKKNE
ncbi:AI-2E family transporter [bacterium]|nr:AI-2E family transporter [bacterium]MCB2179132.1 AI-2E family transporter [bacterium]